MEQYVKYLRKSRFDREYENISVEETLKRHDAILNKLANERGYYIVKTYHEVVSGESIAARPEIQKLLEEVNAGLYAGVLVVDLERLARGNGADQAYISQVFQFSGTKIITPQKTYDPCNEFDEEYFEFGLFMSRREYKTITRRLIRGRDISASEGKYLGSIAPYGYSRVKISGDKGYTLELNPEEAPHVKKIFELFLNHNGTKLIANYLNDRGIRTRHGDLWSYCTISNMITNPVYMGKIRRGWSQQVRSMENGQLKKRIKRKKELEDYKVYPGLHPALISEEDFLLAQEIRREKQPSPKVRKEFDLQNAFVGLLYCADCGKRIGRTTMSQRQNSRARFRCVNGRNCHNSSADYEVVEKAIVEALAQWLEGYKVKVHTTGYADEIASLRETIAQKQEELTALQTQLDNAFDLVEQGVYNLEVFKSRREKLETKMAGIHADINAAETTAKRMQDSDAEHSSLIPQTETLLASYHQMSNDERNRLLKAVLMKIDYHKGKTGKIEIDLYPRIPRLSASL